ncbi:MAG: hypothetical protein PWP31_1679 [Clostridia bacterium]|nr:hypothetical protein [Clostridia bacterium]
MSFLRLARFSYQDQVAYGEIKGEEILELSGADIANLKPTGKAYKLADVKLLAPSEPTKVVCLGLNYVNHAEEWNLKMPDEPIIFLKPPSSIIGPGESIIKPKRTRRMDFEGELGVVIGRRAYKVSREDAKDYILGYTCGNDVSDRHIQKKDRQWTRAKGFNTFCPLGPWIETDLDPSNVRLQTLLNDEVKQDTSTSNLAFKVDFLIEFISSVMTLEPGDVILTGTPEGTAPMEPGDKVTVRIEGIGDLTNNIVAEE